MKYEKDEGYRRYITMKDIEKAQSGIHTGDEYTICGLEGHYRVLEQFPDYILFLRHGLNFCFNEPYEYPITFHRADLRRMDLVRE